MKWQLVVVTAGVALLLLVVIWLVIERAVESTLGSFLDAWFEAVLEDWPDWARYDR